MGYTRNVVIHMVEEYVPVHFSEKFAYRQSWESETFSCCHLAMTGLTAQREFEQIFIPVWISVWY